MEIVLDWPRPVTDFMDWTAIHNATSSLYLDGLVSWPNPDTGWLLLDEWWNVYEHHLIVRALKRQSDAPYNNATIDNAYKFWRNSSWYYLVVCHGCPQANGGISIYNP